MPGGHLTYEDRRTIAEGLREGLAYAEIARRLGRPRSTVGREIARNGGPHGYRAARAQRATEWRARRRPAPSPSPPAADARGRDPEAVRAFQQLLTERLGGVPSMAARVLACLFTSDTGVLTVADLTERLHVSPASISKGVGYLEQAGLLRRERDNRRERYVIDDEVWYRAWLVGTRSMMLWAETVRAGVDVLGPHTPAGARLRTASRFFELLNTDMAAAAEHYRQTFSGDRDAVPAQEPPPGDGPPA
ncbi:helix-turn-helix domain-containing protein [Nonomuraea pusilla]|uniref:MarR family protein n=1 Tax=Nonomuraea pusilla TaxID=46177 RepID=A0A1H8HIC4_9ACTN|nr:helix-turn-helix domain-containing protein [Nonomuraea pusilla]SEN55930.1 MarR family protein [Nonomuraea pusilla]